MQYSIFRLICACNPDGEVLKGMTHYLRIKTTFTLTINKTMKKLFLTIAFLCLAVLARPQDFFRGDFDSDRDYLILLNPTAGNIEEVSFLIKSKLLDIDTARVSLVGVYHSSQKYDFSKSADYISANGIRNYFLFEVHGNLPAESLFRENECTAEFRKIFENSAGIIFFGGPDIPPAVYGEENLYSVTDDPGRHYFEVSLLFHLLGGSRNPGFVPFLEDKPGYMVTGFCLGMQSMNVATGGTLYQDIPAQIYNSYNPETTVKIDRPDLHRNYWQEIVKDPDLMGINLHPVTFTGNRFFGTMVKVPEKLRPLVYSSHHQAVKAVGEGFEVTALSHDGKVVEGIAHKKYPNVFAVQFHPEVSALYEDRAKVKFSPSDKPATLHHMLGKKSLAFHRLYWRHISDVIDSNLK
jgi:putative glutamine amidotransferase